MNKLYGALMQDATITSDYSWYEKHWDGYLSTERIRAIRDIIVQDAGDKLPLLASVICNMVLYTQFGRQIKELDSNNTYSDVTRPKDSDNNDSKYCIWDVIKPVAAYQQIRMYLEDDIASTVDTASWLDLIAAGCLQILREAVI